MLPEYAELHCLSNFTFLRGASHPEELVERAQALGYSALALTDECSVAGAVRAHVAAKRCGLKLIIGAEIELDDGLKLVLLATSREGYGQLCALITRGRMQAKKGGYRLERPDLGRGLPECIAILIPPALPAANAPAEGGGGSKRLMLGCAPASVSGTVVRDGAHKAAIDTVSAGLHAATPPQLAPAGERPYPGDARGSASKRRAMIGSTVAPASGHLLHASPIPAPRSGAPSPLAEEGSRVRERWDEALEQARFIASRFPGRAWIAAELLCGPNDRARLDEVTAILRDAVQVGSEAPARTPLIRAVLD